MEFWRQIIKNYIENEFNNFLKISKDYKDFSGDNNEKSIKKKEIVLLLPKFLHM